MSWLEFRLNGAKFSHNNEILRNFVLFLSKFLHNTSREGRHTSSIIKNSRTNTTWHHAGTAPTDAVVFNTIKSLTFSARKIIVFDEWVADMKNFLCGWITNRWNDKFTFNQCLLIMSWQGETDLTKTLILTHTSLTLCKRWQCERERLTKHHHTIFAPPHIKCHAAVLSAAKHSQVEIPMWKVSQNGCKWAFVRVSSIAARMTNLQTSQFVACVDIELKGRGKSIDHLLESIAE